MCGFFRCGFFRCGFLTLFSIVAAQPVSARRGGAPPGVSGGPAGLGEDCIACHTFNSGLGFVSLQNAPRRYRAGALYSLQIQVGDPEQLGAGFQISVEDLTAFIGSLEITDPTHTQLNGEYATQTRDGYLDSLSQWTSAGGSYTYSVNWRAPAIDQGRATFFTAGNAVNDYQGVEGDHYYFTHGVSTFAVAGDSDADEDVDLRDFAAYQNCFNAGALGTTEPCLFSDFDSDGFLSLADLAGVSADLIGPIGVDPGEYLIADETRGGLLYDNWTRVIGVTGPTVSHPLYPANGPRSGATTYRCKECHGWDYKGVDGAYGSDPTHVTGISGIFGTTRTPQEIFDLLAADTVEMPGLGHNMDAYGMTDHDIWDVTRMTLEATVDTDGYILPDGTFIGLWFFGQTAYESYCFRCHGADGRAINFGSGQSPSYVGTVADANPWELLHKIRFGHPKSPMGGMILQGLPDETLAHLGAYCATLPP